MFSALGLYPYSATDPEYLVTVPLFDEVKWKTSTGKYITISNPARKRNLNEIQVNGKKIDGYFVPHDLFKTGGEIKVLTR